jgi:DNA-binding transcriptional regulator GbsR (MarR family)
VEGPQLLEPTMSLNSSVGTFIDRIAMVLEAEGLPRIAGRIFGFLLVHEGAYSLDDLAEGLQVSKASVSTNARLLEQIGLLERTVAAGDRRDYYRMDGDAWERMLHVACRRWETMRAVLSSGVAALPPEMEVGRSRLCQADRFHALMLEETKRMVERWKAENEVPAREDRAAPLVLVE